MQIQYLRSFVAIALRRAPLSSFEQLSGRTSLRLPLASPFPPLCPPCLTPTTSAYRRFTDSRQKSGRLPGIDPKGHMSRRMMLNQVLSRIQEPPIGFPENRESDPLFVLAFQAPLGESLTCTSCFTSVEWRCLVTLQTSQLAGQIYILNLSHAGGGCQGLKCEGHKELLWICWCY